MTEGILLWETLSNGRDIDQEFDDTSEGFTLGGPIIKDKAFFFVAYESNDKTTPINYGPVGSGAPFSQPITIEQVDKFNPIHKVYMVLIHWDTLLQVV